MTVTSTGALASLVFLARNAWDLYRTVEDWPNIRFSATRERS